jgi:serine/threonine protein kinase
MSGDMPVSTPPPCARKSPLHLAWLDTIEQPTDEKINNYKFAALVGNGSFGFVWRIAKDRVLKAPKLYEEDLPWAVHSNWVNRMELLREKAVYERLGSHDGIIKCFKALDESIELAFANQGDLEHYVENNPPPPRPLRARWIRSLVDTFNYVHFCRVAVGDVALRNILVHDNSLKLCDFGESYLLPLETDMAQFSENRVTPQVEILFLGCVLYSIAVWKEFKYDYWETERWPEPGELPEMDGIVFASVISKCFNKEYCSMEALQKEVQAVAHD